MTSLGFAISAICERPVTIKGSSKVSGDVYISRIQLQGHVWHSGWYNPFPAAAGLSQVLSTVPLSSISMPGC